MIKRTQLILDFEDEDQVNQPSNYQQNAKQQPAKPNIFKAPQNLSSPFDQFKLKEPPKTHTAFSPVPPPKVQLLYQEHKYSSLDNNTKHIFMHDEQEGEVIQSPHKRNSYLNDNMSLHQPAPEVKYPQKYQKPHSVNPQNSSKKKIKLLKHTVMDKQTQPNFQSFASYNAPNVPPPFIYNFAKEQHFLKQSFNQSIDLPLPAPMNQFFSNTNESVFSNKSSDKQSEKQSEKLSGKSFNQSQISTLSPKKFNKSKFRNMIEIKIPKKLEFSQNQDWINHIKNIRYEWKHSKSVPMEIRIMLNQLKEQSRQLVMKSFENVQAVSEPLSLSSRFHFYEGKTLDQIKKWAKEFPVYRKIRGDGNCFYRAFNFSFLEMALTHKSSLYFLKFLSVISDPTKVQFKVNTSSRIAQNPHLSPSIMRSFVLHRLLLLYSYRITLAEQDDPHWQPKIINLLQQVFNEHPYCFDAFLIVGLKNYIVSFLEKQEELRVIQQFDETIKQILKYGQECQLNQFPIRALSEGLSVSVALYQEIDGKFDFESHGEKSHEKVIIYYRKGHYDVAYPDKEVYAHINSSK